MEGKKEIKIKFVAFLSILVIIAILIIGGLIFNFYKERLVKEKKIASISDEKNNLSSAVEESKDNIIIGETTSIEISILDENAQGLTYTEPVKIEDQDVIKRLVTELNNSEELSEEFTQKYWITFEGCPEITFNLKDGSKIGVIGDVFSGPYENKFVFKTSTREDWTADGVYRLKSGANLVSYINKLYEENKPQDNNNNTNANASTSTNTNTNTSANTNTSNKNSIIGETTSIEISVQDPNAPWLGYTKPIKIDDKDTINYLVTELNNSEKLSKEYLEEHPGMFGNYPEVIVFFNLKDGSKIGVVGEFVGGSYEDEFVFETSTKEDWGDGGIYELMPEAADGVYELKSEANVELYISELYEKNKPQDNNSNANTNVIIGETTSIEIELWESGSNPTKPIKINDKHTINYLVNELNNSEEISGWDENSDIYKNYKAVYENSRMIITFNLKNQPSINVWGDTYSTGHGYKYIFTLGDHKTGAIYKNWSFQLKSGVDLEAYVRELFEKNK